MKSTFFATAAFLIASVSAAPAGQNAQASCEAKFGPLPCGSTSGVPYNVTSGDTLTKIAGQFKSGICDIARYNNITDENIDKLEIGQALIIPQGCAAGKADNTTCVKNRVVATGTETCVKGLSVNPPVYVVIPGDTTLGIANSFALTLDALEAPNRGAIQNFDTIAVNTTFAVPICQGCRCDNEQYTIKSGDTFSAIAESRGLVVGQVLAANPMVIPTSLQIGQVVNAPKCQCAF
ncbi:LytE LysM repeat protein [Pyrenophora tritici-repentis]|nr:LytE LysM repeat protein [Pyrenophora tritici-repentis]